MGDFNARVGQRMPGEHMVMGSTWYGIRDKRGGRLIQFSLENHLTIINSIFKKNQNELWTWLSPKKNKSQIDYVLSNMKNQFTNVEVINGLSFNSDHRLVRSTLYIEKNKKSRTKYARKEYRLKTMQEETSFLEKLEGNLNKSYPSESDNVELYYHKIKTGILDSLNQIQNDKNSNHSIISEETKNMIRRRNELRDKHFLDVEEKNELKILYKSTHRQIKKEYEQHRLKIFEKHLCSSGSLKKGYKELNKSKNWIPSLQTNLKKTYSRPDIIHTATEFYRKLYGKRITTDLQVIEQSEENTNNIERFTEIEIFKNLEKLKIDKSSGPDRISNEILK
ncbi:Endonuclease-reverse transcriptase, partial [Operophtera brumata]